jgi:5-formyltetrahydrofolate cyclo-ligase
VEDYNLLGLSCLGLDKENASTDLTAQKFRWRKKVLALRQAQELGELLLKGQQIIESLEQDPRYLGTGLVLFYASFGQEVFTHDAIKRALAGGKQVALPVVEGSRLRLALIEDFQRDLAPGAWGILEPKPERARWLSPQEISLVIVPGVAFDDDYYRLGYGKGYYDRLLSQMPQAYTIGLAYELQVVSRLPCSARDVRVNCIITEKTKRIKN